MSLFLFEARRLRRDIGFVTVLAGLLGSSVAVSLLDPEEPPLACMLLPLAVTWVAAYDLGISLRTGRLDVVLSRGVSLPSVVATRFALAASLGAAALFAVLAPGWAHGSWDWEGAADSLLLQVYAAAAGAVLGLFVSGAAAVLLAVGTSSVAVWWSLSGCAWLTGRPAFEPPWNRVTMWIHLVADVLAPLDEWASLTGYGRSLDWLRLPLAALLLIGGLLAAHRLDVRAGGG